MTLALQVALVGNDNDGKVVLVLDAQDLLVKRRDFFKRVSARDGVDAQKAFARSHVLLPHGTAISIMRTSKGAPVFLLACSVENVKEGDFLVNDALLAVRVLNGRIVFVHKVRLDELNGERRLADACADKSE